MENSFEIPLQLKITKKELSLRNRQIADLDQIFKSFTDNELDRIEKLDIRNNLITNIDWALSLKSLRVLKASNNQISTLRLSKDKSDWEKIDLRYNLLTACDVFENTYVDWLLLANNNISKVPTKGFIYSYLDLSNNRIESLKEINDFFLNCPVSGLHKEINLQNNPLTDIDSLKKLTIPIKNINEYDCKETNAFDEIRKDIQNGYHYNIPLKGLFERINERKVFIYIDKHLIRDHNLVGYDGTQLPSYLRSDEFNNFKYIEVGVDRKHSWEEFCAYFGLHTNNSSSISVNANQLIKILVTATIILIFGYLLVREFF